MPRIFRNANNAPWRNQNTSSSSLLRQGILTTQKIVPFAANSKHPSDGSKNGDVGHAWIYLQGNVNGESIVIEGGHSGELGICQPKYFDGIMNYVEYGYADSSCGEMCCLRNEPNPVKYLWASQAMDSSNRVPEAIPLLLQPKSI